MSRTVWKFSLEVVSKTQLVHVPRGARLMSVAMQGRSICLWLLVDPAQPADALRFTVRGTGHEVDAGLEPVGTAFEGGLVWHVFIEATQASLIGGLVQAVRVDRGVRDGHGDAADGAPAAAPAAAGGDEGDGHEA